MKQYGKNFEMFMQFILHVKNGKKTIIHGQDYVVMSRNLYEEITKPKEPVVTIDGEGQWL